jgi:hypothetical protein
MSMLEIAEDLLKKNPSLQKNMSIPLSDSAYQHATFMISGLGEYINLIGLFDEQRRSSIVDMNERIFFRGMSNYKWALIPSIARCVSGLSLLNYEDDMIREFRDYRPEEFKDSDNYFYLLAKMQHFGLPTRLLDFSSNPVVSLFFACDSEKEMDGRILLHLNSIDNDMCNIISSTFTYGSQRNLSDYVQSHDLVCWMEHLGIDIKDYLFPFIFNKCIIGRPQYITEREKRQSAFLMAFSNEIGTVETGTKEGIKYRNMSEVYALPDSDIRSLIDEEESCSTYLQFMNSIREISNEGMKNNFISILISKSDKDKILRELDTIGINKSFLFPELEYTAEEIKNKYYFVASNSHAVNSQYYNL